MSAGHPPSLPSLPALTVLILSDGRPGHYHLSDGVAAAVGRLRPVEVRRLPVRRRRAMPVRMLAWLVSQGRAGLALRLGYGLSARDLGRPGLIVSAGGDTVAANAAAALLTGAPNVYCGTLKHVAIERVSLVITSYDRFRDRPRHLVALKPSAIGRASAGPRTALAPGRAPALAGLLIGGDSGYFRYQREEWQALLDLVRKIHDTRGTRWIVSTSRRTAGWVADAVAAMAGEPASPIAELIDFRHAGPGTLPGLFARVEAVLATGDSSTMISEAVAAGIPVVGIAPRHAGFKDEEGEYRAFMERNGWVRFAPLATMSPERLVAMFGEVTPLAEDPLDRLAVAIVGRLPELATQTFPQADHIPG